MSLRYEDFHRIIARRDTPADQTKCGHPVRTGDRILYHHRSGVYCSACSVRWATEVQAERAAEVTGTDCVYDY